jgi:Reverse transcriptase (RNA-dependent DNA polymerase)
VYVLDEPRARTHAYAAPIVRIPRNLRALHEVFNHAAPARLCRLANAFPAAVHRMRANLDAMLPQPTENRIPQLQGDGTTVAPQVSFVNESADPSHLLPFGQNGRTTNTVAGKTKLAPRSIHFRYLGAPNQHHYRVLIPAAGKTAFVRAAEFSAMPVPAYAAVHNPENATLRLMHPRAKPFAVADAPTTWRNAISRPDAETRAATHDDELRRHEQTLGTWTLEPPRHDCPRPYIFTYKPKSDEHGAITRRIMRCSIRGDLMLPGLGFDPARTSAHTPSHVVRRLLLAAAAAAEHAIQSRDVPGAYPRAAADPNYRQTMQQPPNFDVSLRKPVHIAIMQKEMKGAPNAGSLWSVHRNCRLEQWGWTRLRIEPSSFVRRLPNGQYARMLADTDDFLVTASTHTDIDELRAPLDKNWQVTVNKLTDDAASIRHTGLKIAKHNGEYSITNPVLFEELLASKGLLDCKPRLTPHQDGADLLVARPDEPIVPTRPYQSVVGVIRYLADTTHPELSYIAGILGRHLLAPTARHGAAVNVVLRYLQGHPSWPHVSPSSELRASHRRKHRLGLCLG